MKKLSQSSLLNVSRLWGTEYLDNYDIGTPCMYQGIVGRVTSCVEEGRLDFRPCGGQIFDGKEEIQTFQTMLKKLTAESALRLKYIELLDAYIDLRNSQNEEEIPLPMPIDLIESREEWMAVMTKYIE